MEVRDYLVNKRIQIVTEVLWMASAGEIWEFVWCNSHSAWAFSG